MFVVATPGEMIYFITWRPEPEADYRELSAAQNKRFRAFMTLNQDSFAVFSQIAA
jgi:hypothetical protein